MTPTEIDTPVRDQLADLLAEQKFDEIAAYLGAIPHADALRQVLNLSVEDRDAIMAAMPADIAAMLIDEAPDEVGADLVEHLDPSKGAEVIAELTSDRQADVVGEMEQVEAEALLGQLEDAEDVRRLMTYDDSTAGGLMTAEAFTFGQEVTVSKVIKALASDDDDFERYRGQHPYMLDDDGRPVGVVSLRALLTAKRTQKLSEIMTPPLTVGVDMPLEELEDIFDAHPFLGLPVVDEDGRLAGALSRHAVDMALAERAESESLRRQGVFGDELRSMPLRIRSKRRLMWLSANIGLNIIAASVISAYEETLAAVIAIAIFLPMVSDMSGCSGNQAVGVTMRELSLGLVRPVDAFRVWLKEISVGLINGIVLGILIGLVAWFWKGNPALGLVIGLALAANTMIAVSIGGVVPLLLKRFGQDPAAASGPLLTTITDMAGFFLVLSLATLFMPYLV